MANIFHIHFTPILFNVKHILYKIVRCTVHIKIYFMRLSKVLQGVCYAINIKNQNF